MAEWTHEDIDEWFGGDMEEARKHMAYEREQRRAEIDRELTELHSELEGLVDGGHHRTALLERIASLSAERLGLT